MRVAESTFPNRNWCSYLSASFLFHVMGLTASTYIYGTLLVFHVPEYGNFCFLLT